MAGPDLLIVGAYMVAMLGLSAWFARGQTGSSDYYLAGRRLP